MQREIQDAQLEAYLEESLSADEMASVEAHLRSEPKLLERLTAIIHRRDAGVHTLGEIWRRHRLSCPTREQLGSYLLQVLDETHQAYLQFHLETVGCRFCQANLDDLRERQRDEQAAVSQRRRKYFESSAGYLRGKRRD